MNGKYALFAAIAALLACGPLRAQQADTSAAAPSAQSPSPTVAPVKSAPPAEDADQDEALLRKVRALRRQLREEFHKKRVSTPEEAADFREKAVDLYIEYHNLTHARSSIPLIDDERLEVHSLIGAHPRICARLFGYELEIYKSTSAYDYKAQAESMFGADKAAEADWTAAIKIAPEPELLRHRGHLYLQRHQYDKAIADFTACIKAGGLAPVYHARALAYFHKDDYAAAADDLAQFFRRNTDSQYAASVARSRLCRKLRKRGFDVEGCEPATGTPEEGDK